MKTFFRRSQVWLALLTGHLVLAAPSLCLAGLLKHACECESTMEDGGSTGCSEGHAGGCSPEGCSHDDCENDPCQTRSTNAPDRPGRIDLDLSSERLAAPLFLLPSAFLETVFATGGPLARLGHRSFGISLALKRIPFFSADIPLLR